MANVDAIEGVRTRRIARRVGAILFRWPAITIGLMMLITLALAALLAPLLAPYDPLSIDSRARLRPPSEQHWFGTDHLGRDLFSRVLYGGRVSLVVGLLVATLATLIGVTIGVIAGYVRAVDNIVMRFMDAMMSVPGILLAFALVAVNRPSIATVIAAIVIPEVPRVARLVRSVVLSIRERLYIEAAEAIGTRFGPLLLRHILPNAAPAVMVQASYVCASAIIAEAILSFLGAGVPPDVVSWGSIIAEGRERIFLAFHIIAFPGLLLTLTVLAVNLVGDGLRDSLDPRLKRRL